MGKYNDTILVFRTKFVNLMSNSPLRITAAIARPQQPFSLSECQLLAPEAGEVLVRMEACGICHTDLTAKDFNVGTPMPAVLGHEGVGVVEMVGANVHDFTLGDRVLMSFASCGHCSKCRQGSPGYCYSAALGFTGRRADGSSPIVFNGEAITGHFFGQSSFATHAIASTTNMVKLPGDVDSALMAPLACGVQTGMASVMIALNTRASDTVAIFGCGTVGLSAIMAAKIIGCRQIIAVDIQPQRLELAQELGATLCIDSRTDKPTKLIRGIGGAQRALDCTGIPDVILQAFNCLDSQGMLACAGVSKPGSQLTLDLSALLYSGRSIRGTIEGDAVPREFIPRMISWYQAGLLPLEKIVRRYPFAEINTAVADMHNGHCIKPVLVMP